MIMKSLKSKLPCFGFNNALLYINKNTGAIKHFSQNHSSNKLKNREVLIVKSNSNLSSMLNSEIQQYDEVKWMKILTTITFTPVVISSGIIFYLAAASNSTAIICFPYFKTFIWCNLFYQSFSFGIKINNISQNFEDKDLDYDKYLRLTKLNYILFAIVLISQFILWKKSFSSLQATFLSGFCLVNSFWFVKLKNTGITLNNLLRCGVTSSALCFGVILAMKYLNNKGLTENVEIDETEYGLKHYKSLKEVINDDMNKMQEEESVWSEYAQYIIKKS